jgi:hypothetical protein
LSIGHSNGLPRNQQGVLASSERHNHLNLIPNRRQSRRPVDRKLCARRTISNVDAAHAGGEIVCRPGAEMDLRGHTWRHKGGIRGLQRRPDDEIVAPNENDGRPVRLKRFTGACRHGAYPARRWRYEGSRGWIVGHGGESASCVRQLDLRLRERGDIRIWLGAGGLVEGIHGPGENPLEQGRLCPCVVELLHLATLLRVQVGYLLLGGLKAGPGTAQSGASGLELIGRRPLVQGLAAFPCQIEVGVRLLNGCIG